MGNSPLSAYRFELTFIPIFERLWRESRRCPSRIHSLSSRSCKNAENLKHRPGVRLPYLKLNGFDRRAPTKPIQLLETFDLQENLIKAPIDCAERVIH